MDEDLAQLAQLCGIGLSYRDALGDERQAQVPQLVAVLDAMGVAAGTPAAIAASTAAVRRGDGAATLPAVRVVYDDAPRCHLRLDLGAAAPPAALRWQIETETGERREGQHALAALERRDAVDGEAPSYGLTLELDGLPCGYHRLALWHGEALLGTMLLVVAPRRCYLPEAVRDGGRLWGLTAQLYALRSARNWGIGDFTDLCGLVEAAAAHGAGVVGVNPLHALFPHNPRHASPYSPSSRLFLNTLYLDVERIVDAQGDAATRARIAAPAFREQLRALRAAPMIDYAAVAQAKRTTLESAWAHFRRTHLAPDAPAGGTTRATALGQAFRDWCAGGGTALHRQGLFEALQEHFFAQDTAIWGWPVWPEAYRHPEAPAVERFAREHAERVEFYLYLQWHADEQLGAVGRRCLELGLGGGLYADLAVSVDRGGAETWANQSLYAVKASVGAPPDPFNLLGQDWGLPPWIAALRANMRHAAVLRIDHVMALMRLYWVPPGVSAVQGVYVAYPFEDLLGILALESQRNRCLVIGEDLGTVPPGMRERLAAAEVLSYRLMYFERDAAGDFQPPAAYPRRAIAAISTHDLPTLAGWWIGRDLQVREALGHFPSAEVRERQWVERAHDRARLLAALAREGLLPAGVDGDPQHTPSMTPALCAAAHRLLARSPALVVVAQLEDALGVVEQANLPGTTDEHPNWRRKLPEDSTALADDPRLAALGLALAAERPRRDRTAR